MLPTRGIPVVASTPSPAKTSKRHTTLGQRLVVLFALFSAAPLFASNFWGYLQSREYLTEHAFRNVRDVAALEASQTLVFVDAKRDLVPLIVAGNLDLFALLRSLQSQTDPEILATLQRALRKQLVEKAAEDDDVQEFFVLSPTGELMASTREGRPFREDLSAEKCFHAGSAGPRIVGFEYPGAQPTLVVAAPVADEFGKSWGVLCGRFAFNLHQQLSVGRDLRTPEGSLYLIDAGGRVVDAAVEEGTKVTLGMTLARNHPVVGGTQGWDERTVLPSGEEVIAAYAPVPNLGWGVLVEVPVSRALAGLTRLKWQAAVAGSLLTMLLVVMTLIAARGMSGPLARLSAAARHVAGGSLGERVSIDGPREVSDLADTFNQMSLALSESHRLLEQRVADATRELRQAQEFTELLLNSIDQRVVVIDPALRIIKANRVALKAYGDGVVGHAASEVTEEAPVRRAFETGAPATSERSERKGEGQEILRLDTLPVRDAERNVEAVMLVGRVVTAEKRLQAELLHHEKMSAFGLLAAGMAHEIGNPLASIAAQLRMNRDATEPERIQQTFAVVEREVERVSRLLRDLVSFARRRRDDVTLVQLNDVVEDVSRMVTHDQRARNVRIVKKLMTGLPGVRAKEDHLMQVLLNLSLNAIDAMGGSGMLTLETTADAEFVTCRVIDTGPGIPPEVLPRVFEAFFTTKEPGKGTGLGLFVSRDLVDSLGGKLEIERTSSEGTVFAAKLPIGARPVSASGGS